MKTEIIAVGSEILLGQILNTNARFLSQELSHIGIDMYYQTVVGDNTKRLLGALHIAFERVDCVILTGGLGPTKDDLTKETLAEYFGRRLVMHQESLDRIEGFFKALGRPMTPNNEKQALMPEGALVLKNDHGTAPGYIIEQDGKTAIILPGPPGEMQPMFLSSVIPFFSNMEKSIILSRSVRIFGMGESLVEHAVSDLLESTNPTVAPYAKEGEVELRVTAKSADRKEAQSVIYPVVEEIKGRVGQFIYGYDDTTLQKVLVDLLTTKKWKLAVAESCTGGLVGSMLTEVSGVSEVFLGGIIAYANSAKEGLLGVQTETLSRYGAVSAQTACEMAQGARNALGADLAIAVTGIAGPTGASEEKPIGLVFIGIADQNGSFSKELRLVGSRERIRKLSAMHAINAMREHILKS